MGPWNILIFKKKNIPNVNQCMKVSHYTKHKQNSVTEISMTRKPCKTMSEKCFTLIHIQMYITEMGHTNLNPCQQTTCILLCKFNLNRFIELFYLAEIQIKSLVKFHNCRLFKVIWMLIFCSKQVERTSRLIIKRSPFLFICKS